MLTYQAHPKEVQEMQNIINSGKFFSITFVKKDNTIRFVNGHKHVHVSTSSPEENRGKFSRLDANILLIWDNNKTDYQTGERGSYISAKLERILYFKSGEFQLDLTGVNSEVLQSANITPEMLQQIQGKMKLQEMIGEEINMFFKQDKF